MKKALMVVLIIFMFSTVVTAVAEDSGYIKIGDYGNEVIRLHQKLGEFGYYGLRPESPWSAKSADALKILQENMGWPITGIVENKDQLDIILALESVVGKNLAVGSSSEWSEWMTPTPNEKNRTFRVAVAELMDKSAGDYYTWSVEIEFKDVTATDENSEDQKFWFRTQGSVDGAWDKNNPWTNFVSFREAPADGVSQYAVTKQIDSGIVESEKFELGFRCDYWKSGSFRVRNVKVEKGAKVSDWCLAE